MKIDEIRSELPDEDAVMLDALLLTRDDRGDFAVGARRIAELVSAHTPWTVGKTAVASWRRANSDQ